MGCGPNHRSVLIFQSCLFLSRLFFVFVILMLLRLLASNNCVIHLETFCVYLRVLFIYFFFVKEQEESIIEANHVTSLGIDMYLLSLLFSNSASLIHLRATHRLCFFVLKINVKTKFLKLWLFFHSTFWCSPSHHTSSLFI